MMLPELTCFDEYQGQILVPFSAFVRVLHHHSYRDSLHFSQRNRFHSHSDLETPFFLPNFVENCAIIFQNNNQGKKFETSKSLTAKGLSQESRNGFQFGKTKQNLEYISSVFIK